MSFISAKLLAIEIVYNGVFNSISLPLEWHLALMGSLRSAVLVCAHNAELFLPVLKTVLASNIIFSSFLTSFPMMCYLSFPLLSHVFLPVLHATLPIFWYAMSSSW